MATLGELNILLKVKGLSSVQSSLRSVKKELDDVDTSIKSAKESAAVFTKEFEKEFKKANTELNRFGRNMAQVSASIRNTGLIITGAFTAAFVSTRKELPEVEESLKEIESSFKSISISISQAALPALQDFSKSMSGISKTLREVADDNPRLIEGFLRFGAVALVIGTVGVAIGTLLTQLAKLRIALQTLGILTTTGALSALGSTILVTASAGAALVLVLDKIANKLKVIDTSQLAKIVTNAPSGLSQFGADIGAKAGFGLFGGKSRKPISISPLGPAGSADRGGPMADTVMMSPEGMAVRADAMAVTKTLEDIKQKSSQTMSAVKENVMGIAEGTKNSLLGIFNGLMTGIGDAVAQSIVYGENFKESMVNILKSVASEIISMLVGIIAKIIALRALGVVGPIPASALFAGETGFAQAASGGGILKNIGKIFGFADGGVVTKPTVGLVGEAGPEAIIPLDEMNKMGGAVSVTIQGPVFLNDESAMDKLVRKMSDALKRASGRRTGGVAIAL